MHLNTVQKFFTIVVVLFFISIEIYSQGVTPLLSGKVISEIDGKPIVGTVKFFVGNEVKAKSKIASDGTYSTPVPTSSTLTIVVENHLISPSTSQINTPKDYAEITFDIKATPITEGMLIGTNVAFQPNGFELTEQGTEELDNLIRFANENIKIYFTVKVNNKDSYFENKKEKKTIMEGKKKKTITETIKAEDLSLALADKRVEAVKNYVLGKTPRKNFFIFESDASYSKTKPKAPAKNKKSKTPQIINNQVNNLIISVNKLR